MDEPARRTSHPSTLVADGGTVQESYPLRRGGSRLSVTDDAIEVERNGETVRFAFDSIVEVSHASYDFFLTILSVALVGFGIMSLERNLVAGVAFTVIGLASLYRTWNRRGQLKFRINGRAKPLIVYPEHAESVYDSLEPYVAAT